MESYDESTILVCPSCGRIVEEHLKGGGPLICCGREMIKLDPNSQSEFMEEHKPRVYSRDDEIIIEVGMIPHEMEGRNRILWIEVIGSGFNSCRVNLRKGRAPEASFRGISPPFRIKILCSKHGLWEFTYEPMELELSDSVFRAIEKYNSLRGRESVVNVLEINERYVRVEFTGNFCRTCGFYDYFEDFRQLLEEFGIKSVIRSIEEIGEGAIVVYELEGGK